MRRRGSHDRQTGCRRGLALGLCLCAGLVVSGPAAASAQAQTSGGAAQPRASGSGSVPQRETAIKLMRRVTVEFEEQRLEDVINFIGELTEADIEAKYADDRSTEGLDPEQPISLSVEDRTALRLIETVLDRAESEFSAGGNTWQFTDTGTLEIGPKSRLNARTRMEIYPIGDMVFNVPTYDEAPELDLQQILQSGGGGGGGGQSPFQDAQGQEEFQSVNEEEKSQEIIDLILELVEPEQWRANGGDAASIRYWRSNLIVNAPDYVHRQLNGYSWWPASGHTVARVEDRRWVSLNWDSSFSTIEGFEQAPVSAVVGGDVVSSDDPDGGG